MNKQALGRLLQGATANQVLSGSHYQAKIFDYGNTVPTDTSVGYATGCLFLHLDGGAGTAFYVNEGDASTSAFAAVAGLTAAQEALLGAVPGTATASKAIILDANAAVDAINTATLSIGASGSEVAVTATAAELNLLDTTVAGTAVASKALALGANKNIDTLAIADGGLKLGAGAGTAVTATAAELNGVADASAQDVAPGSGFAAAEAFEHACTKLGNMFYTSILVDLTGVNSGGTANDIIGDADAANAHIGLLVAAKHGTTIAGIRMTCLETPAGGDDDIDLYSADEGTGTEDTGIGALTNSTQLTNGGNLTAGTVVGMTAPPNAMTQYLYLVAATGDLNATYTAGKLLIELWGV